MKRSIPPYVIAQNLVDFEQLNAKCKLKIEKCKMKEKRNFDYRPFIMAICRILTFALCTFHF